MLQIIGIIILVMLGVGVIKFIAVRIFPEYGLKEAKSRYKQDPSHFNNCLLYDAQERVDNKNKKQT